MQNFYLSPFTTLVIIISLMVIFLALTIYYIVNKTILSIYKFNINSNIESIIGLLNNYQDYPSWWAKFKKIYIYKVTTEHILDNNLRQAKITLFIHTNLAKETWDIILEDNNKGILVTVSQETQILSKIQRINYSSIFYKKDVINFKKALIKQLTLNNLHNG